jgi:hypothetical protein
VRCKKKITALITGGGYGERWKRKRRERKEIQKIIGMEKKNNGAHTKGEKKSDEKKDRRKFRKKRKERN